MIVLDTHVWVWWLSNPEELSRKAKDAIRGAMDERGVYVSSISSWELALLEAKGRLQLRMGVQDWIARTESLPFLSFVPVDNTIALKSVFLPRPFHDDPADRIIVSTALSLGATLITKDRRILDYPNAETLW